MSHVAGYTVANDISARDWQMKKNGKQWLLGKTFDTFCPLGPALVTPSSLSGKYYTVSPLWMQTSMRPQGKGKSKQFNRV